MVRDQEKYMLDSCNRLANIINYLDERKGRYIRQIRSGINSGGEIPTLYDTVDNLHGALTQLHKDHDTQHISLQDRRMLNEQGKRR